MKINIPPKRPGTIPPAVPEPLAVNAKEAARMLAVSEGAPLPKVRRG